MDPALQELIETGETSEDVAIVIRMREPGTPPPGLRIISRFGPIATGRIARSAITQIYGHPDLLSVKAPRWLASEYGPIIEAADAVDLELRDTDLRRPAGIAQTGKGCTIGVIDWGCDFAHSDFLTDDGRTRLLAIWDQRTARYDGNRFGYGRIHHADAIQAALRVRDPYRMLDYHPAVSDTGIGAHGTHVLSIAAGNGRSGGPEGIAPEASLLFVHLGVPGWDRAGPLGDSSNLLEAIDFMVETAGDRPLVINMSLGRHGGPHDGSTLVELALDWLLSSRPGLAIVQSAGNYFGRDAHSSGRLRSGASITLPFHVNPGDTSPNEVEVWYRGSDILSAKLIAPSGSVAAEAALASKSPVMAGEQRSGTLYHRIADPNNGDNHIHLFQYPNSQPGEWRLVLTGVDVSDGRFNSWIERDPGCRSCQARFDRASVERTGTTGSIAHSLRALVVGAYDRHRSEPALAPFSSSGPTRDGRVRPLLLAPGVKVLAARSQSRRGDAPLLTRMSGTSMASPHVAGTCALIFEALGPIPVTRLRTLLLDSLTPFAASDTPDRERTGFGLLDIEAALAATHAAPVPETYLSESLETEETAMSCIPGKTCCGRCKGLDVECDAERRGEGFGLCCTRRAGATGAAAKKCCGACNKAKRVAVLIEAAVPAESAIHPVDAAESVFMTSPADAAEFISAALAGAGRRWPEGVTAASLFDAMLGRLGAERQTVYARHFGIVGRPGTALAVPIAAGDVLIRRGDGGFAHAALIAHPHLLAVDQARAHGLVLEGPWPGQYVQIIEQGHRPHRTSAKFARRICGADGNVLGDTLILRPLAFSEDAEAAAEASAADAANMRWLQASLNRVINAGLTVDGRDGPSTRAAIRRFQQSRGLTADGIAGERTRAALRAALGEAPQQVSPPPPGSVVVDDATCRKLDRFAFDSATLTPEHNASIAELARAIASANVRSISVTGHASPEGPDNHNLALGQRRADNVASALRTAIDRERAGASAAIAFTVTSRGESQPLGSDGPANRRAEVCFREEPRPVPPPPRPVPPTPRPQPPHANCLLPVQGLRLRPDVDTPEGRRMLTRYERAVGLMKAAAEGPPHNWIFQWYTHNVRADRTKAAEIGRVYRSGSAASRALANDMWDTCAAHGRHEPFFMPWHRMYVEFLEQLCRRVLGDEDFMLPYWNYSKGGSSRSLPAPFRNPRSALFHLRRAAEPRRNVNAGDPIDSEVALDPGPHLRETSFFPGQGGVPSGFSRGLDRGLHGNVHVQIGIFPADGSRPRPNFDTGMGTVPWAANDPIFWMHHCNVDRLWASWNRGGGRNPTDQAWLGQTFIFADGNGSRVVARAGDFVSTDARGYSYDCLEPAPRGARPPGEGEDEAESVGPAIAASTGRDGRRGIALGRGPTRVRLGVGEASEAVTGETITPRSGKRLYLVLRNYRADSPPGTVYRVYLELPANATPEIARRHYVGTFNFFESVPLHGAAAGHTYSFDITELARRLAPHGGVSRTPNVTIVPAGRPIEAARPVIGEISIVER
jgi:outer membrane protein OmpA-like peptidoglycan-associated protein/subtilisin family serine protease